VDVPEDWSSFGEIPALDARRSSGDATSCAKLNFDTKTNVADVYINYLRCKVDSGYGRALIRTVRGVGYEISREQVPSVFTPSRASDSSQKPDNHANREPSLQNKNGVPDLTGTPFWCLWRKTLIEAFA
jgi:hypothetical protein